MRSILTRRLLFPSARALRDAIQRLTGERLLLSYDGSDVPVAVRYGNSDPVSVKDTKLNSREIVELCAHKGKFSRYLKDVIFTPYYRIDRPPQESYPILVRTTLTSFGGKGIIPCRNSKEFDDFLNSKPRDTKFVWTQYYPLSKEYRVHVLGGQIVKLFKKVKDDDHPEGDIVIRNSGRGYSFKRVSASAVDGKFDMLKNSIREIWNGLSLREGFLGVDIGWCNTKKQYLIIEANSAPGISNNEDTCMDYAQYLAKLI